jgi:hypothetical protein
MNYVRQKHTNGCAAACLAMVLGLDYDDVVALYGEPGHDWDKSGATHYFFLQTLSQLRIPYCFMYYKYNNVRLDPWPPVLWADYNILMVQCNEGGGTHFILLTKDGKIWDPWYGEDRKLSDYHNIDFQMTAIQQKHIDEALTLNKSTLY